MKLCNNRLTCHSAASICGILLVVLAVCPAVLSQDHTLESAPSDSEFYVTILVDSSPSSQYSIQAIKQSAADLVSKLGPEPKISVAAFSEDRKVLVDFTDSRQKIAGAIQKLDGGDGTSLYEALRFILDEHQQHAAGKKALIVFTDGVDTTSTKTSYAEAIEIARASGSIVIPVYLNTFTQYVDGPGVNVRRPNNQVMAAILDQILKRHGAGRFPAPKGTTASEYALGRRFLEDLASVTGGTVLKPALTEDSLAQATSRAAQIILRLGEELAPDPSVLAVTGPATPGSGDVCDSDAEKPAFRGSRYIAVEKWEDADRDKKLAKDGISGPVQIAFFIDRNGTVLRTKVMSGHPSLRPLAIAAASKARFAPSDWCGEQDLGVAYGAYNFEPSKRLSDAGKLRRKAEEAFQKALEELAGNDERSRSKAMSELERAASLYAQAGDRFGSAETAEVMGKALQAAGDPVSAAERFESAAGIYGELGTGYEKARTLHLLGQVLGEQGRLPEAARALEQSAAILEDYGDSVFQASVLSDLSILNLKTGKAEVAEANLKSALELFDLGIGGHPFHTADNLHAGQALAFERIAALHYRLGNYDKALEYFRYSLPKLIVSGDRQGRAAALYNISAVESALGRKRLAVVSLERSLAVYLELKDEVREADVRKTLGNLYFELEQGNEAVRNLEKAAALYRIQGRKSEEAEALSDLGLVFLSAKDRRATENFRNALAIRKGLADPASEIQSLAFLTWAAEIFGNTQVAVFYGKLAVNSYLEALGSGASRPPNFENTVSKLAELLEDEGRTEEASEVHRLLAQPDLFSGEKRQDGPVPAIPVIALTAKERSVESELNRAAEALTQAGRGIAAGNDGGADRPLKESDRRALNEFEIAVKEFANILLSLDDRFKNH